MVARISNVFVTKLSYAQTPEIGVNETSDLVANVRSPSSRFVGRDGLEVRSELSFLYKISNFALAT